MRGRIAAESLPYVGISVSNDLDEYTIQSLIDQGAPIDSFGVGTKLATCYDQPALGGVYKLSARRASEADPWTPVVKLSEQPYKRTIPGGQRVRRYYDGVGGPVCDMIYDEDHLAGEGAARGNTLVAENDAAQITATAQRSIESQQQQALVSLKGEVCVLATALAGKILGCKLESDDVQSTMIDQMIADLDSD